MRAIIIGISKKIENLSNLIKKERDQQEDLNRELDSSKNEIQRLKEDYERKLSEEHTNIRKIEREKDDLIRKIERERDDFKAIINACKDPLYKLLSYINPDATNTENIREPVRRIVPVQKPIKITLVPIMGQINTEILTKFIAFVNDIPGIEVCNEGGINCYVTTAITERVEQFYTGYNITKNTIPIVLQRRNTSALPPQLKDPFGNLVIVYYSSSGKFDFKDTNGLVVAAKQIAPRSD